MVLKIEKKGSRLYLTLNRPERGNSLDPPTLFQLREEVLKAQEEEEIKVIVLTGTGERDFCTGLDVGIAKKLSLGNKINLANIAGDIATTIYWGKPTVVGINGRAMGMGLVFSAAADYRVCVKDAVLQMPEVRSGIFPGASCIAIMGKICGISATKRMLMVGESFSPEEGTRYNLIDEILEREAVEKRVNKVAKKFARSNDVLLRSIKTACNSAAYLDYNAMLSLESKLAGWPLWTQPQNNLKSHLKYYKLKAELTGDVDRLEREYQEILKD